MSNEILINGLPVKFDEKCKLVINGYTIYYNEMWNKWQYSHPEIGFLGENTDIRILIDLAERG